MEARPCHSSLGAHAGRTILPRLSRPDCAAGPPTGGVGFSQNPFSRFRQCRGASRWSNKKKLREGELYSYMVVAHPAPPEEPKSGGLSVTNASPGVPAQDASLDDFLARAMPSGVFDIDDMPVFVSRRVLEEAAERTHAEEGTETGGILIGRLWREPPPAEIFAEMTAQIPAEHTSGTNVKLTFTPQVWTAADAALRLRARGRFISATGTRIRCASGARARHARPKRRRLAAWPRISFPPTTRP